MSELADPFDSEAVYTAILEGGPADLVDALRRHAVAAHDHTVKVRHLGGYEHFERTADPIIGDGNVVLFRWTTRTFIAE